MINFISNNCREKFLEAAADGPEERVQAAVLFQSLDDLISSQFLGEGSREKNKQKFKLFVESYWYFGLGKIECHRCGRVVPTKKTMFDGELIYSKTNYSIPRYCCIDCGKAVGALSRYEFDFSFENICRTLGLKPGSVRWYVERVLRGGGVDTGGGSC